MADILEGRLPKNRRRTICGGGGGLRRKNRTLIGGLPQIDYVVKRSLPHTATVCALGLYPRNVEKKNTLKLLSAIYNMKYTLCTMFADT